MVVVMLLRIFDFWWHQDISWCTRNFQTQQEPLGSCRTSSWFQLLHQQWGAGGSDSTEDRPVGVELMHTSADTNGAAAPGSTRNLPECSSDAFHASSAASLCSPSWFLSLWSQRLCGPGPGRSTLTCVDPSLQPVNFTRMAHLLCDLDRG